MPKFSLTEQRIIALFPHGSTFTFNGTQYTVITSGKPRPDKGECKTDVYVCGEAADGNRTEIKISVKQPNADFLENKISLTRAIEIFGQEAPDVIRKCTESIRNSFTDDCLVCFERHGHTYANTMKLGWKFELMNKPGGLKSGLINLTDSQKTDVFAGTNLSENKRNCYVNDKFIPDSGVANYIIVTDGMNLNAGTCLSQIEPVDQYAKTQTLYFACKALNYRHDERKWDGDRPLAVYVRWFMDQGKLNAEPVFDDPLQHSGNEIGNNLLSLLRTLNVGQFHDLHRYLAPSVRTYP